MKLVRIQSSYLKRQIHHFFYHTGQNAGRGTVTRLKSDTTNMGLEFVIFGANITLSRSEFREEERFSCEMGDHPHSSLW